MKALRERALLVMASGAVMIAASLTVLDRDGYARSTFEQLAKGGVVTFGGALLFILGTFFWLTNEQQK